jgi:hypothetical protein
LGKARDKRRLSQGHGQVSWTMRGEEGYLEPNLTGGTLICKSVLEKTCKKYDMPYTKVGE